MYPQELIDYLHDSPSALKVCSLVSHQFYPRTRVHLFRRVNYDNSKSVRVFDIARGSPHLLQCIKRIQFRCLHFFLPKHQTAIVDLLHSLSFPVTLPIGDDNTLFGYSKEGCNWRHILPAFVPSAPYLAITSLELISPQWHAFLEFHHIVLLPNVTDLYLLDLEELAVNSNPAMPAPSAPRIRTMRVHVSWGRVLAFWEGLRTYRSMYLDHLDEFRVTNTSPDELCAVVQTANLASNGLKVLEINCIPSWDFTGLSPNISPLHLNPATDLRLGGEVNDSMLPFISWWINCFKTAETESTVLERLTIKLAGGGSPVTPGQLEPLKRAFGKLSDLLSNLVRNVDLVFQVINYPAHPGLCTDCLRGAIVDACGALKEKANSRVFDMEHTYDVPVFPFPASSRQIL
ncbi:hypothetical protein ARMGADRAFT_797247 [Armillaria gallica]|uniref:F-box domain-containing protein n=1 Tax=Armillaria gallica TaxID=47427 RepID=A0A2H3DMP8_ARMGA|nr:hypothetical protein ARMGADRAFT_797247 [Armillaria gallica]